MLIDDYGFTAENTSYGERYSLPIREPSQEESSENDRYGCDRSEDDKERPGGPVCQNRLGRFLLQHALEIEDTVDQPNMTERLRGVPEMGAG